VKFYQVTDNGKMGIILEIKVATIRYLFSLNSRSVQQVGSLDA